MEDIGLKDVFAPFFEEMDPQVEIRKILAKYEMKGEDTWSPITFFEEMTEDDKQAVDNHFDRLRVQSGLYLGEARSSNDEKITIPAKEKMTICKVPQTPDVLGSAFQQNYLHVLAGAKQKAPKDRLTHFELMNLMLSRVTLRWFQGEFYYLAQGVYCHLQDRDLHGLIFATIQDALQADGNSRLLAGVATLLRANTNIRFICTTDSSERLYFLNGALEVPQNILRPVGPLDFFTSYLSVEYPTGDGAAVCPNFDRFLKEVSGGDPAIIQTIWEMLGYIIVPGNEGKCFFLLQGVGNSGKSVLGSLIGELFNPEAVTHLDIFRLGGRFDLSALQRARVNISMDLASGRLDRQAVSMIKAITGDDGIPLEGKFKDVVFAKLPCKMVFGSNFQLSLAEYDEAFLNRLVCIPFRFAVPPERQDKQLLQKLRQEKPAIVVRAIAAYKNLASRNFRFLLGHGEIGKDVCGYSRAGDVLGEFLAECCEFTEDAVTATSELYRVFCDFCKSKGYVTVSNAAYFSRQLNTHCAGRIKNEKKRLNGISQNCYIGIRLKGVLDHE